MRRSASKRRARGDASGCCRARPYPRALSCRASVTTRTSPRPSIRSRVRAVVWGLTPLHNVRSQARRDSECWISLCWRKSSLVVRSAARPTRRRSSGQPASGIPRRPPRGLPIMVLGRVGFRSCRAGFVQAARVSSRLPIGDAERGERGFGGPLSFRHFHHSFPGVISIGGKRVVRNSRNLSQRGLNSRPPTWRLSLPKAPDHGTGTATGAGTGRPCWNHPESRSYLSRCHDTHR